MSRDLALSLLRTGSTGEQILLILETIVSSFDEPEAEPEAPAAKVKSAKPAK